MPEDGKWQINLIRKLSFTRFGGTDEEQKAAGILEKEIRLAGGEPERMEFCVPVYHKEACRLTVLQPYQAEIEVVPYEGSGITPEKGLDLNLVYLDRGVEEDYEGLPRDLSETVVLLNELSPEACSCLLKYRPAAFLTISGKYCDRPLEVDLPDMRLREEYASLRDIPGGCIRAKHAMEMVQKGACLVHFTRRETMTQGWSQNILATILRGCHPEEEIVLTAHYDSVAVGKGSWDNASGAVNLMYLYRYFMQNPPARTMRFVWCGCEEQGLLGSRAYVRQRAEALSSIVLCFNFDMCGITIGQNVIHVTGGEDLRCFAEQFCKEMGFSAQIDVHIHSSDSKSFAAYGIPAIGISRVTKSAEIHTRNDVLLPLSGPQMETIGRFSAQMISRIVNARTIPVKREIPAGMEEELQKSRNLWESAQILELHEGTEGRNYA